MKQVLARISTLSLPTWVIILAWLYCLWRVVKAGYLQDALKAAKGYVRPIKF